MGREADTLLQKAEVGGGDPALREYELRNTVEKYIRVIRWCKKS